MRALVFAAVATFYIALALNCILSWFSHGREVIR